MKLKSDLTKEGKRQIEGCLCLLKGLRRLYFTPSLAYMESLEWGACREELAKFLVTFVSAKLANPNVSDEEKIHSLKLMGGFGWGRTAMRAAGPNRLATVIQRSLRLRTTAEWAKKLRERFHEVWHSPPQLPVNNAHPWWELIASAGLSAAATDEAWTKAIRALEEVIIFEPSDLDEVLIDQLRIISEDPSDMQLIGKLWRARMAIVKGPMFQARPIPAWHIATPWDAFKLADAIAADSASSSTIGFEAAEAAARIGVSVEDTETLGPRAKLLKISENALSIDDISTFADWGAKLNILRSADASLRSVASGIRCWALFCDTTSRPHFPPSEEGVLAWSSFFAPGRTFSIYVSHLEKACALIGVGLAWRTKAVTIASHGLAKSGDNAFAPRPAITTRQLVQLINTRGLGGSLARIALLSWVFLLRVQSECIPLTRQRAGEDLLSEERLPRRAVIGLQQGKLIIKLNRRKHMAAGATMVRCCICADYPADSLELHVPQLFCPVCSLWPAIRASVATGGELFPAWSGKRVLSELRAFAGSRQWDRAGRLGTHAFRRGAARAILKAGGSFAQLLRAGQWHSSAYKLYLDLGREESQAVAEVLIEASDGEV